jgi:hypothetical protein
MFVAAQYNAKTDSYWINKNAYYYRQLVSFYRFYIPQGSSVLCVGSRSGYILNELNPSLGVGIDENFDYIEEGKSLYTKLKLEHSSFDEFIKNSAYASSTFDYIILPFSLMDEYDIQIFFEKLKKFCHPRTRIILNICSDLWGPLVKLGQRIGLRRDHNYKNWLQIEDVENFLDLAGYDAFVRDYRTLIPFYIPLVSYVCNAMLASLPLVRRLCLDRFIIARPLLDRSESKEPMASVIVTCKNERGNIENALKRLPKLSARTEVIFAEGGSSDGTVEEIKRVIDVYKNHEYFDVKYVIQKRKGKGDAVREGFNSARGDILFILDGDLTTPPEEMLKFWNAILSGKGDLINGARLVYAMESKAMRFLNLIANKLFSLGFSWVLRQRIRDTLCGTKVLWKKDWEEIQKNRFYFGDFDPFGDFDLLFGAAKQGLKILDMPVHYKDREYGSSQISRFRNGTMLLWMSLFAFKKFRMY